MSLSNKVAMVTGGARGIGRAIALKLGTAGARIAICDVNRANLDQTVQSLRDLGIETVGLICDVSDSSQVDQFVNTVEGKWAHVDFLVNNAGISKRTPLTDPGDEAWHRILSVNLTGVYFCSRRCLREMPTGGRIINISSTSGKMGEAQFAAYCASKHGVIGLTRVLALEMAPRKITVNAICPGWTDTDMARLDLEESARFKNVNYEEQRSTVLSRVPLNRMIFVEEIAELAYFLILPAASAITGQAINICGGEVMY